MSCPHPRPPVERIVGDFSELVCPDCHARLASVDEILPEVHVKPVVDQFVDYQAIADEALELGILEERLILHPSVKARIEDDTLILDFADGESLVLPDDCPDFEGAEADPELDPMVAPSIDDLLEAGNG